MFCSPTPGLLILQVGIVEAFGKFQRLAYPGMVVQISFSTCGRDDKVASPFFKSSGCNCLIPCLGEGIAGVLSLRVHQLDVKCEIKTKDNVRNAVQAGQ